MLIFKAVHKINFNFFKLSGRKKLETYTSALPERPRHVISTISFPPPNRAHTVDQPRNASPTSPGARTPTTWGSLQMPMSIARPRTLHRNDSYTQQYRSGTSEAKYCLLCRTSINYNGLDTGQCIIHGSGFVQGQWTCCNSSSGIKGCYAVKHCYLTSVNDSGKIRYVVTTFDQGQSMYLN